jgi:hypothetical protein
MTRRRAALVLAVAAFVAAVVRVAAIGPSLALTVSRTAHNDQFDKYSVIALVRGGETIDEVTIEPLAGPVRILGNASMPNLPPGWKVNFEVLLVGDGSASGKVRVTQKGRSPRSYDVEVGGTSP